MDNDPRLVGSLWTPDEDVLLLRHVARHGTKHWGLLQACNVLPHRDQKACCNRFILLKRKFFQSRSKAATNSGNSKNGSAKIHARETSCGINPASKPIHKRPEVAIMPKSASFAKDPKMSQASMLMAAATALAAAALKAKAQSEAIQVASSHLPDDMSPFFGDLQKLGVDGMPSLANFQSFGESLAGEGAQENSQGSVVVEGSSCYEHGRSSSSLKLQNVDLDTLLRALEENDGGNIVPDVQKVVPDSLHEISHDVFQPLSVPQLKSRGGNQSTTQSQSQQGPSQFSVPSLKSTPSLASQSSFDAAAAGGSQAGKYGNLPSPSPTHLNDMSVAQLLGLAEALPGINTATSLAPHRSQACHSGRADTAVPRTTSSAQRPPSHGGPHATVSTAAGAGGGGSATAMAPRAANTMSAPTYKSLRPDMFLDQMASSPCAMMFGGGPAADFSNTFAQSPMFHTAGTLSSSSFHVVPSLPPMPSPMGGGMRWSMGNF